MLSPSASPFPTARSPPRRALQPRARTTGAPPTPSPPLRPILAGPRRSSPRQPVASGPAPPEGAGRRGRRPSQPRRSTRSPDPVMFRWLAGRPGGAPAAGPGRLAGGGGHRAGARGPPGPPAAPAAERLVTVHPRSPVRRAHRPAPGRHLGPARRRRHGARPGAPSRRQPPHPVPHRRRPGHPAGDRHRAPTGRWRAARRWARRAPGGAAPRHHLPTLPSRRPRCAARVHRSLRRTPRWCAAGLLRADVTIVSVPLARATASPASRCRRGRRMRRHRPLAPQPARPRSWSRPAVVVCRTLRKSGPRTRGPRRRGSFPRPRRPPPAQRGGDPRMAPRADGAVGRRADWPSAATASARAPTERPAGPEERARRSTRPGLLWPLPPHHRKPHRRADAARPGSLDRRPDAAGEARRVAEADPRAGSPHSPVRSPRRPGRGVPRRPGRDRAGRGRAGGRPSKRPRRRTRRHRRPSPSAGR